MTREQGWLMKTRQPETIGLIDTVPAVALVLPASSAAIGEIRNAVGHFLASIDLPAETVQAADIAVSCQQRGCPCTLERRNRADRRPRGRGRRWARGSRQRRR